MFYSSIDAGQVRLANMVSTFAAAHELTLPVIDGYRYARMSEKLGISHKMPALVTLRNGIVEKVAPLNEEADIERVLA